MKVELKVVGGSRSGQTIPISIPQFMIGRAEDCHLKPRSELISRYHCTILVEENYVGVRDLGSKNGVYVNGERISVECELKNGDRLLIGPLEFEVVLTVGLKAERKSKVESIAEIVARTVEQSSINAKRLASASVAKPAAPVEEAKVSAPVEAPKDNSPVAKSQAVPKAEAEVYAVATSAEEPKEAEVYGLASTEEPKPEPVAVQKKVEPVSEPVKEAVKAEPVKKESPKTTLQDAATFFSSSIGQGSSDSSDDSDDLADWLLGDDDSSNEETQTMTLATEDLDLPYTPKETEEPKEEEKSAKSSGGPNTSDAAADLLKNFFRGGR